MDIIFIMKKIRRCRRYMLEKNPELNQPEQELVADDAVKTFRKIIQKKHTEETQETEERASVFSYAATACLVLAVSDGWCTVLSKL